MKTMLVRTRHMNSHSTVTSELAHYWYDDGQNLNSFIVGVLDGTINAGYSIVSYSVVDPDLDGEDSILKSVPRSTYG